MHGLKNYNLSVEPWPGNPGPNGPRGRAGYRWRVNWQLQGEFYAEGFEDSHSAPRAAAEAFLGKQGIQKIGRAHDGTPVTNAQLVCRLMLEQNKNRKDNITTQKTTMINT